MNYRSTNADGRYVHFGGALVSGAEFGSGIELNPNSSGANPNIMPAGDETNKGITLKAKGSGTVTIGDSSNSVQLAKTFTIEFTPAVLAASTSVQSTITVTGLSTGRPLLFTPITPGLSMAYAFRVQCSTASELRFTQQNITASTIGTGESTARGVLIQL